jgi:kynurenine formamidase
MTMGNRRIIDLSMPVHNNMVTFPRIVRPALVMYETWEEFAEHIGAAKYGVTSLTASYMAVMSDHVGTHIDALKHLRHDGPGPETIPIDDCYGDGVVLDFRHKERGAGISAADVQAALGKLDYRLKPRDIVLIMTGAGSYQHEDRYLTDHSGMTAEATLWLIAQGIRVMGIDAVTFDPPVWAMFERRQFWEAHRVMNDHEYYHLENLTNLDQLAPFFGFTVAAFPVKWTGTTAAPVRAVAIFED